MSLSIFLLSRFNPDRNDTAEILRALEAAICDDPEKKRKVTTQFVHYYDKDKGVLYVDDGANGVYRLDGKEITVQNNGDAGVFFRHWEELSFREFLPDEKVVQFFYDEVPAEFARFKGDGCPLGLSLAKFYSKDCLLNKYLVANASFATLEESGISPEEQKLLLIIYFFTVYFESLFTSKPVAAFIGELQSGKSFLATTIGKIIFGPTFRRVWNPGQRRQPQDDLPRETICSVG